MADTIVNTPERERESPVAWVFAAVIILALIIAAVFFFRDALPAVPNTGNDINVTVPAPEANVPNPIEGGASQ